MDLQTGGLISDIKLTGSFPDGMFADADYISFLNTGYFNEILPFILRHNEEYYVTSTDLTYANTLDIPSDAMGEKLRDLIRVTSGGTIIGNVPRLTYEEMSGYDRSYYRPAGFYLEGNKVKFFPEDAISDTIRMYYFERPNKMTLESNCMELTSVSGADASGTVPSTWTTSTEIHVVSNTQPYTVTKTYTISAVDTDAGTITLSSSGFAEGDFICPSGFTAIPRLPFELRDCLIQSAIVNALVALKDVNGVALARDELAIALNNASGLISRRVEGEPKKLINPSGLWRLRGRSNTWRY